MDTVFFWAAAAVSVFAVFIHVFVGGRLFVRPFLRTDIPDAQKWMAYYVWHTGSVSMVFLAGGFVAAAMGPEERGDYAIIATAFAACFVGTALFVCLKAGMSPRNFPAVPMFSVVAALGLAGLLS